MGEKSGVSGWLRRVFGASEKAPAIEQPAAADSAPRPLPKEGPRPAPITPAGMFKPSADDDPDDDLDSLTIIPGPDSDGADGLNALRKEIVAELEAERAKHRE